MVKALIAEKDDISLYAYIDEPTNLVKYYTANNQTFYSYSSAKNFYDNSLKALSDNYKKASKKVFNMILLGEKLKQDGELKSLNTDELFKFLSIYNKGDLLFVSSIQRKFPHISQKAIEILFNALCDIEFVEKIHSYTCPICGHKYYSNQTLEHIKEYEELCCEYCDEETPFNQKYLGFGYKVR